MSEHHRRRVRRRQFFTRLALAAAALPFVFAFIRLINAGDARLLLMALVACVGAVLVMSNARPRQRGSSAVLAWASGTFAITTLLAALAAILVGARSAPGVLGVSIVFGLCYAAAYVLRARARREG